MRLQVIGSVAIAVCLAACSSGASSQASGSPNGSLGSQIEAAMKRAQTVRVDSTVRDRKGVFIARGQCLLHDGGDVCHFRASQVLGLQTSVSVGGFTYTSSPDQGMLGGKQWLRIRKVSGQLLPFVPNSTTRKIGVETIDGIRTTHYRFSKRIPPPKLRGASNTPPPEPVVIDLWIDAHHLVRRLMLTGHAQIEVEHYSDMGVSFPPITAPPADRVTDNPFPSTPEIARRPAPPVPPTTAPTQVPAP